MKKAQTVTRSFSLHRLDENCLVKVSDFGLARHLNDNSLYVMSSERKELPLRWMSPEAITSTVFSIHSDVVCFVVDSFHLLLKMNIHNQLNCAFSQDWFSLVGIWDIFVGGLHIWWDAIPKNEQYWSQNKVGNWMEIATATTWLREHVSLECKQLPQNSHNFFTEICRLLWRYELMTKCWRQDAPCRPSFSHIVRFLEGAGGDKFLKDWTV